MDITEKYRGPTYLGRKIGARSFRLDVVAMDVKNAAAEVAENLISSRQDMKARV
jgi:hypothetical protein